MTFSDAVIREVFEETGLIINSPQLCGVKQWNEDDGSRYIVLCYKTNHYTGDLKSSDEVKVSWVSLVYINNMKLASGMEFMMNLFSDDSVNEHCFHKENGEWIDILK